MGLAVQVLQARLHESVRIPGGGLLGDFRFKGIQRRTATIDHNLLLQLVLDLDQGPIAFLLLLLQLHDPAHGDKAMGFSHGAAKHTFRLFADGGAIEVRALDPDDAGTIAAIRAHLQSIAKSFADGDFSRPMAVHDRLPDGAATMKKLRKSIEYRYGEIPSGGRVSIVTSNRRALGAVHEFLRFQIREHETGDPLEVTSRP